MVCTTVCETVGTSSILVLWPNFFLAEGMLAAQQPDLNSGIRCNRREIDTSTLRHFNIEDLGGLKNAPSNSKGGTVEWDQKRIVAPLALV